MTITQIQYFVAVAEHGHLTQVAQKMHIAQPSLTQSLKRLEKELSFPLFERKGRRLYLSKEGIIFLPHAKAMVRQMEETLNMTHKIVIQNQNYVTIAYSEPVILEFLPDIFSSFTAIPEYAHIQFISNLMKSSCVLAEIRQDMADLGFCSSVDGFGNDIDATPLFTQRFGLIVSNKNPLSKINEIHPKDLINSPCISYAPNSCIGQQVERFWDTQNIHPIKSHCVNVGIVFELVARNLGWAIALMPQNADYMNRKEVICLPFPELDGLTRTNYMVTRKGRRLSPAASQFEKYILQCTKFNKNA